MYMHIHTYIWHGHCTCRQTLLSQGKQVLKRSFEDTFYSIMAPSWGVFGLVPSSFFFLRPPWVQVFAGCGSRVGGHLCSRIGVFDCAFSGSLVQFELPTWVPMGPSGLQCILAMFNWSSWQRFEESFAFTVFFKIHYEFARYDWRMVGDGGLAMGARCLWVVVGQSRNSLRC